MSPICNFYLKLKEEEGYPYFEKSIAYHASLVHLGLRPAVLINFSATEKSFAKLWCQHAKKVLAQYQLQAKILGVRQSKLFILFYDEKRLTELLADQEVRKWLHDFAQYNLQDSPEEILKRFTMRFREHTCPDEMGVFLGYPLEDVQSYIEKGGDGFAYCGYWKVYHNLEQCLQRFREYDQAKLMMANRLLKSDW